MLSEKQQKCFKLSQEGKSIKEIAEEMGVSYSAARDLLYRTYHTLDRAQENPLSVIVFSKSVNSMKLLNYLKRNKIDSIDGLMEAKGLPTELIAIREELKEKIYEEVKKQKDVQRGNLGINAFIARAIDDHRELEILKNKIKIYSSYYRKKCNVAREKSDAILAEYEQICEIFKDMQNGEHNGKFSK